MVLPRTFGSDPRSSFQRRELITTDRAALAGFSNPSSSGRNVRPRTGLTRSVRKKFAVTRAAPNWRGRSPPKKTMDVGIQAARSERVFDFARQSMKSAADASLNAPCASTLQTNTSDCGSGYRTECSSNPSRIANIAEFAPIPSASTKMIEIATNGVRNKTRAPNRRS